MLRPFHLAIAVDDLSKAEAFYGKILNCTEGRRSSNWIDWDFFGHQLVTHLEPSEVNIAKTNIVDGQNVPARHFGIVLEWDKWEELAEIAKKNKFNFVIEPYIRFKGEPGEQGTFFFYDPFYNALEFKAFKNDEMLFAK